MIYPLVISFFLSLLTITSIKTLPSLSPLIQTYMIHPMTYLIAFVFILLFLYAIFQFIGIALDKARFFHYKAQKKHNILDILVDKIMGFISGRSKIIHNVIEHLLTHWKPIIRTSQDIRAALDTLAEENYRHFQKHTGVLELGIWLLPLLGFIGTVIGITQAIDNLGPLISENNADSKALIQPIMQGLATAFYTTFMGLVAVIPIMILWRNLRSQSLDLLQLQERYLESVLLENLQQDEQV